MEENSKIITVYLAEPDTWYDANTICILINDFRPTMNSGLFFGWKTCESGSEARMIGTRYLDEEICNFDEFRTETLVKA